MPAPWSSSRPVVRVAPPVLSRGPPPRTGSGFPSIPMLELLLGRTTPAVCHIDPTPKATPAQPPPSTEYAPLAPDTIMDLIDAAELRRLGG
ncbi:hypothetical protein G7Z17_g12956 [Cylindrodendrum hubeiense]|uniref:Uncharacterized protein n=1 Tax=Cylindrodendrum hubeiense TaxID=595255 RepID=A0A9P5L9T0_9HYPO|nr:hypothetical protein G7Z17_g12956 [Cylindrodendrum hubeiense]